MADIRLLKVASGGGYAQADDTDVLKIGSVEAAVGMVVGFDGTPAADQIQIGDANFVLDFGGGTVPLVTWDTGSDDFGYVRSTNLHRFRVGGTTALTVGAAATLHPDGTGALPSIGFLNDTGTGWFLNGAGLLSAAVSGAERVRVQTDGIRLAGSLRTNGMGNAPETNIDNGGSIKIGRVETVTAWAAQQDNFALGATSCYLRLSSSAAASRTVTGMTGGFDGRLVVLDSSGHTSTGSIVVAHESASSTAANRFNNSTGANITLAVADRLVVMYEATTARWKNVSAAAV
jgi:hypothetical protein